jgi:hypothetical protein
LSLIDIHPGYQEKFQELERNIRAIVAQEIREV